MNPAQSNLRHLGWAAREAGCCGAVSKEDCQRPPCSCNREAWTEHEREMLRINRRKKAR